MTELRQTTGARWIGFSIVFMIVFAGCAADPDPISSATDGVPAAPAEFDEKTGAVQGRATSDEGVPLAGVDVLLVGPALKAITDEAGRFVFHRVAPGSHEILAERTGFESASSRLDVVAGQVTNIVLLLVAVPGLEPYHLTQTYNGILGCAYHINLTANGIGVANDWCSLAGISRTGGYFAIPDWLAFVEAIGETTWRSTQTFGQEMFGSWAVTSHRHDGKDALAFSFLSPRGPSPLRAELNRTVMEGLFQKYYETRQSPPKDTFDCKQTDTYRCEINHRHGAYSKAPGATFQLEQRFDVHFTRFYHEAAPDGYSALPDS